MEYLAVARETIKTFMDRVTMAVAETILNLIHLGKCNVPEFMDSSSELLSYLFMNHQLKFIAKNGAKVSLLN